MNKQIKKLIEDTAEGFGLPDNGSKLKKVMTLIYEIAYEEGLGERMSVNDLMEGKK